MSSVGKTNVERLIGKSKICINSGYAGSWYKVTKAVQICLGKICA